MLKKLNCFNINSNVSNDFTEHKIRAAKQIIVMCLGVYVYTHACRHSKIFT